MTFLKKTVQSIEIEDYVEYLQEIRIFFNYKSEIVTRENDCLIYGIDEDSKKKNNTFTIKGIDNIFFGNAVLVKLPPNGSMGMLKSTTIALESLKPLVTFKN